MRNLLRKPLVWMILAECAVVAALILVAWHWVAASSAAAAGPIAISLPATTPPDASPLASPRPHKAVVRQLPGLNVDAGFWRTRLGQLNRDQAMFELLEWRIVHSAMDAIQRYTESVVLPSVERAERGG